MDSEYTWFFI